MERRREVLLSELLLNPKDILQVSKLLDETFNSIPKAGVKWQEFGMELLSGKDDDNVLSSINNENYADRCQKLLNYWKSVKAGEGEGWSEVIRALKAVGLTGPADKLENALKDLKHQNSEHQASEGKQHYW